MQYNTITPHPVKYRPFEPQTSLPEKHRLDRATAVQYSYISLVQNIRRIEKSDIVGNR
jgi:hypothetical protein